MNHQIVVFPVYVSSLFCILSKCVLSRLCQKSLRICHPQPIVVFIILQCILGTILTFRHIFSGKVFCIRGGNYRCFSKQRQEDLLVIRLQYRTMQMVKRPSAFSITTNFNGFRYQKKSKNIKPSRKRKIIAKNSNQLFPDRFDLKKEKAHNIRGPPAKRAG